MILLIAVLLLVSVWCWPVRAPRGYVPEPPCRAEAGSVGDGTVDPRASDRESGGSNLSARATAGAGSTVEDVADAVVLLAVALHGGAAVTTALDRVAALTTGQVRDDLRTVAAAQRWGLPTVTAWSHLDPCWGPVALVWEAAEQAGVEMNAANDSLSQRSCHHFIVTRSPNHMWASSWRIVIARRSRTASVTLPRKT